MAGYGEKAAASPPKGDAEAMLEAGKALGPQWAIEGIEGVTHLISSRGGEVELRSLEELHDRPRRARGKVKCHTPEALLTMIDRYGAADTVIYASRGSSTVTAVFDDHLPRPQEEVLPSLAGWRQHRAVWTMERSPAWLAWRDIVGKKMPQAFFVDFLEDRRGDVKHPEHAELLEIVRDLQGTKEAAFRSAVDLRTGGFKLAYDETIEARASGRVGEMVLPDRIWLAIELYRGGAVVELECRLRFRVEQAKLVFFVIVEKMEELEERAFRVGLGHVANGIAADRGIPILEAEAD
jgi:uncharacterized protein YfdQ (DUF2303 family)